MTNAAIQIEQESASHLAREFDPYAALIDFGWPVNSFGLYLYLNVGIVAFLWLVRHCQPETRERTLLWALRAESMFFVAALVWAGTVLIRLHSASLDMATREIDRAFTLAAFVQARDGIIRLAILSGVIGLCVTYLLWRGARKTLKREEGNCEPQGGGYSPPAARSSNPTP